MSKTKPSVGVGVLIFKGSTILLGQRLGKHGTNTWGPPGGGVEFGESFEDCAIRETKEETGLLIQDVTVIAVTNNVFTAENTHCVSVFLRAQYDASQQVKNMEPDKVAEWRWFNMNNLPDKLFLPLYNFLKNEAYFISS